MRRIQKAAFGSIIPLLLTGCSLPVPDIGQARTETEIRIELTEQAEAVQETTEEEKDLSRGDLFKMFEDVNNEEIQDFVYEDYNKDGIHEAFVITRQDTAYHLWYMSPAGCEAVERDFGNWKGFNTQVLTYRTKEYLLLQQTDGRKKNTLVFSVDNANKVQEAIVSDAGYFYQDADGDLLLQVPDADGMPGNTYYMYYSLDDGFREYGAIPISEEQFLEFDGAQAVLETLEEELQGMETEYTFLYRSNHRIHINIRWRNGEETGYKNLTVTYDTGAVKMKNATLQDGRMETACMLDIATFPTAFRHPVHKTEQ